MRTNVLPSFEQVKQRFAETMFGEEFLDLLNGTSEFKNSGMNTSSYLQFLEMEEKKRIEAISGSGLERRTS